LIIKINNDNKNNKEYQDLRGNPMREKTTDGDEHKTIHYVKEYKIDLRRSIGITTLTLSLSRIGRRGIEYTRYFSLGGVLRR
jgi:hypothetical protein